MCQLNVHCNTILCMHTCRYVPVISNTLVRADLQTIEASLNMCCGNLAGLQNQFQEAGTLLLCLAHVVPRLCTLTLLAACSQHHPACEKVIPEEPVCCLRTICTETLALAPVRDARHAANTEAEPSGLWPSTECILCCLAVRQNFNVVRIFGFPVQMGFNLQTAPGRYNEYAFTGLDRVISEAGKAGLKLVIALTNNWNYNSEQTDWK